MASGFNKKDKRRGLLNELIKSPKQVRPILSKSLVENCLIVAPYRYICSTVEEIVFSNVSFCSDFLLLSIAENKLIIIENCIFHGEMTINCLKSARVIVRNCQFKTPMNMINLKQDMLEMNEMELTADDTLAAIVAETTFLSKISTQDRIILN